MSDAADVGGSPIGVDGYEFHPLEFSDLCEFEQWVKSRAVQSALDGLNTCDSIDNVDRIRLIQDIVCSDMSRAVSAEFNSFTGQRQLILMSLRKGNPEVTPAEVDKFLSIENVGDYMAIVDGLTYPEKTESEVGEDEESHPPTRPAGRQSPSGSRKPTAGRRKK